MCPRWFLSAVSFIGTLTSRLPSSAPCNQRAIRMAREQVLGDRDGLLGYGRPAKIHGPVDGGLSCPLENYQRGVGSIPGRFSSKHWISSRFAPRSKLN